MDVTQLNRSSNEKSNASAATTRKRRSSILKSQRPPRTPFSELEFNVATPTDTAKSRRVSFSRRTGIAEFVTNEATTAWKSVYEEHNKSLESSGNDFEANNRLRSIGHIGRRVFEQQFQDEEADFIFVDTIGNPCSSLNTSLNNVNITQQIASLETIDNAREMLDKASANASTAEPLATEAIDDLDEIQRDLQQGWNAICQRPFRERRDVSQYIEMDLNKTHFTVANDECDMSITDTIHNPKVQEVSRNDKSLNKDWIVGKENIALNPYVAPKETENFAVNEKPDEVLVFDGKKLIVQSQNDIFDLQIDYRKTLLPNASSEQTPPRKTIVVNINDDLPNFLNDGSNITASTSTFLVTNKSNKTVLYTEDDLSITQPLPAKVEVNNTRRTILFDEVTDNLSVTKSYGNILIDNIAKKRETILGEANGENISITQALPSNIVSGTNDKRKTIVYEDDVDDISLTQAISCNIILADKSEENGEKQKTMVFEDSLSDVSVTKAVAFSTILPKETASEKRKTIVFDDDTNNLSITQAVPTNIVLPVKPEVISEKRRTILFDEDLGNISVTQAIPTNIILCDRVELTSDKRKTIVFEVDKADISVTQPVPNNIVITENTDAGSKHLKTVDYEKNVGEMSITREISTNIILADKSDFISQKNKTSVYESSLVNVSNNNTQAILSDTNDVKALSVKSISEKRNTIYANDLDNLSITQVIPSEIILPKVFDENLNRTHVISDKRKTILYDDNLGDVSVTQIVPSNIILQTTEDQKQQTFIYQDTDLSMTKVVTNEVKNDLDSVDLLECVNENHEKSKLVENSDVNFVLVKRKTIMFEENSGDLSVTKPVTTNILDLQNEILNNSNKTDAQNRHIGKQNITVYQADIHRAPIVFSNRTEQDDLKRSETEASNNNVVKKIGETPSKESDETIYELPQSYSETQSNISIKETINVNISQEIKSNDSDPETKVTEGISEINNSKFDIISDTNVIQEKSKKSLLNDLLDMSDGIEDKGFMAKVESDPSLGHESLKMSSNPSKDSYFYITRDSDDDTQTDKELNVEEINIEPTIEEQKSLEYIDRMIEAKSPLPLEYMESDGHMDIKILKTLDKPKEENSLSNNRHYKKIMSSDSENAPENETNLEKSFDKEHFSKTRSFRDADNTKELLDILSDFTDGDKIQNIEDDEKQVEPIKFNDHIAIEDKSDREPKRLSFAPSRQSIVISRENLLNNISMAQAMLQKSRIEIDESIDDDTEIESLIDQDAVPKKNIPISNEIRKTLRFDESASEASITSETKVSPLKKTVFGETSYMKEDKAKVIPSYLKDVSDGIKDLMRDLVKPMADVMPFEMAGVDKDIKKCPSTRSTQIQANLLTSSQIDLDIDTVSEIESLRGITGGKYKANPISIEPSESSLKQEQKHIHPYEPITKQTKPDNRVLIFDHANPLNNVLLTPVDFTEVHKYDPVKSTETLCSSERSQSVPTSLKEVENEVEPENITQCVGNVTVHTIQPSGDSCGGKTKGNQSVTLSLSKPASTDQSMDTKIVHVKDTEINTVITMKGNKELLDASSSLTLVDDTLTYSALDDYVDSQNGSSQPSKSYVGTKRSPVRVIYKITEQSAVLKKVDSDSTSNDDNDNESSLTVVSTQLRKRSYSPIKTDERKETLSSLDLTPKPNSKLRKMSDSPKNLLNAVDHITSEKDIVLEEGTKPTTIEESPQHNISTRQSSVIEKSTEFKKKSPRKSKNSPKNQKPGTTVTVQQLLTDYHVNSDMDQNLLNKQILSVLKDYKSGLSTATINSKTESNAEMLEVQSPEIARSFTSSKNHNAHVTFSVSTTDSHTTSERSHSPVNWQPELVNDASSKNLMTNRELSVNVVAKIDMLPFMGSECEWECSGGDSWSFRLLHGRLRLAVRLARRHENATRTLVRADTPVLDVSLETLHRDKKNSVAVVCVRFAAEAMRYYKARGVRFAGDVPALLRRCAAIARLALRWGRAMQHAKTQLAYTLTDDGQLTLKVANVSLRSVWEVSARVDMVVEAAGGAPTPCARRLRVSPVVADCCPSDDEVKRAVGHVKHDWGHVPRTIWKIFKYLKNKTRDDDLFLGS